MIIKRILYFGVYAAVGCDEKCNKAWGRNSRPKFNLSDNPDDWAYLADNELGLGEAPIDPGTMEGECRKPIKESEKLNKWCIRECERCVMTECDSDKLVRLPDFSKRIKNIKD